MREPISLPAQARALRSLTGLPLAHCRRIIVMARAEMQKRMVMKRRATVAARQLSLDEIPASPDEVVEAFAEMRRSLQEVRV